MFLIQSQNVCRDRNGHLNSIFIAYHIFPMLTLIKIKLCIAITNLTNVEKQELKESPGKYFQRDKDLRNASWNHWVGGRGGEELGVRNMTLIKQNWLLGFSPNTDSKPICGVLRSYLLSLLISSCSPRLSSSCINHNVDYNKAFKTRPKTWCHRKLQVD